MTNVQKYAIISLFERNQINASTLINALDALVIPSIDIVLESLVKSTMPDCERESKGFYIKILSVECNDRLNFIKTIKNFLKIGLKEAKDISDSIPVTINKHTGCNDSSLISPNTSYFTYEEVAHFKDLLAKNRIKTTIEIIEPTEVTLKTQP